MTNKLLPIALNALSHQIMLTDLTLTDLTRSGYSLTGLALSAYSLIDHNLIGHTLNEYSLIMTGPGLNEYSLKDHTLVNHTQNDLILIVIGLTLIGLLPRDPILNDPILTANQMIDISMISLLFFRHSLLDLPSWVMAEHLQ